MENVPSGHRASTTTLPSPSTAHQIQRQSSSSQLKRKASHEDHLTAGSSSSSDTSSSSPSSSTSTSISECDEAPRTPQSHLSHSTIQLSAAGPPSSASTSHTSSIAMASDPMDVDTVLPRHDAESHPSTSSSPRLSKRPRLDIPPPPPPPSASSSSRQQGQQLPSPPTTRYHRSAGYRRRAHSLPNLSVFTTQGSFTQSISSPTKVRQRRMHPLLATHPRYQIPASSSSTPQVSRATTASSSSHAHQLQPQPSTSSSPSGSSVSPGHISTGQPYLPSLHPLITRETLKELDLEAILRNPQLRHDLLFDPGLQFRPTATRRKKDQTDKYWIAVQRELEFGCTCTCFDELGVVYECVCGSGTSNGNANTWAERGLGKAAPSPSIIRMPSRIPPLISELLEVLISVISPPSTSPAPSFSPTLQTLRASLDPTLITQELVHGVFEPQGLFRLIGDTLKCHCAPMRDRAVEGMVEYALKGNLVKAIRTCFEILELMKLDIANHQLQALRPYLLETSPEFELKTFHDRHARSLLTLATTREWISKAYRQVHLSAQQKNAPLSKASMVTSSVSEGIVDLVFNPPTPAPSQGVKWPETFYLDQARLNSFATDASDLIALYMVLLLYRQLALGKGKSAIEDRDIDRVKREIWEVGPSRLGWCFWKGNSTNLEEGEAKWRKGMRDVLLQICVRAEGGGVGVIPSKERLDMLERWMDKNMSCCGPLFGIMRKRLRDSVLGVVSGGGMAGVKKDGSGGGLEPLMPEIKHLGERVAKLVGFHERVYTPLYEAEGFILPSS